MTYVYVCMPYGDHNDEATRLANTQAAMDVWFRLAADGFVPYCPHLSHFLHERQPMPRDFWLSQARAWVEKCDCVLSLGEPTEGMRGEEELARYLGKPVFKSVEELKKWTSS